MKGFKKLFNKKDKDHNLQQEQGHNPASQAPQQPQQPQEGYVTMDSSSLYNMPSSDLVEIIYKYDAEVKHLNQQISTDSEQLLQFKKDFPALQEKLDLFKKHSEELQSELSKVESELADTQTSLENRKAELDLTKSQLVSKDELLANYRKQVEDFQSQISELENQSITIPESTGNCCTDREAEIAKLRLEISKLKSSLSESTKLSQEVQELRITNKMLESEIAKMSIQNENNNTHIKNLNEKIVQIEKLKQEIEIECHKRQINLDSLERELSRMQFQKESMETEIRALRENLNIKEKKYNKKQNKIEIMQEQLSEKTNEIYKLKHELETAKHNSQVEIYQIIENHKKEMTGLENQYKQKMTQLENAIIDCKKVENNGNDKYLEKISIFEQQNKEYNLKLTELNEIHRDLSLKILDLEKENKTLEESLKKSQLKRELARQEVIKLSQKLEQKNSEVKYTPPPVKNENFDFKLSASEASKYELKALSLFKLELEALYKMLMKIMMSSNTTQKHGTYIYSINSDEFSTLEQKLNNVVMQVHEALDSPEAHVQTAPAENVNSWSSKLTSAVSIVKRGMSDRGPVKLFSCMSSQEESKGNMIPKTSQGRRLISNTGGPRSATPGLPEQDRNGRKKPAEV